MTSTDSCTTRSVKPSPTPASPPRRDRRYDAVQGTAGASRQPGRPGDVPDRAHRAVVPRHDALACEPAAAAEPAHGAGRLLGHPADRRIHRRSARHPDRARGRLRDRRDIGSDRRLPHQPLAVSHPRVRAAVRRHLFDPDHPVPAALCSVLRARRDHQLLSDRAQHHRRLRLCRQGVRGRGAVHGGLGLPALPLCADASCPADHPQRHAHGIHHRAAVHHRQRDHRLARRTRPPHRTSRRGHGDRADVRLYRVRCPHRVDPQYACVRARSAGKAFLMATTAMTLRRALRRPWLARLAVIALLFCLWEIAARWLVDPMFLSPPSRVFMSLPAVFETRGVPAALRLTLWELAVAFALSVVIGLVVGLAVGLQPFARRSFMPIILLLYGTPQVTILPLFILYFGIGPASKIAFGVSHGFFPIIVVIVAGVQNIKPILLTSARSMGASRWQVLRHVVFPHMIPSFFAGMRLAMTGVLLAELYVSTAGIGYFTALFTQNFDPTRLFGLIAMLAAMAIALNEMVRR